MSKKTKRQPATPKTAEAKGGSAAPTLLGVVEHLQKELRRQRRYWRKTQTEKSGWCAFHHGVMWGLHLAISKLEGRDT